MSPRFSLDGIDLKKILTGLLIGLSGVAITVLTMLAGATYHLVIGGLDFSPILQLVMAAVFAALINLLKKFIKDNSQNPAIPAN